jgi:arylsulfatase
MIASWPEQINKASVNDHIFAFWDALPTLCEITGVEIPLNTDGISFLPSLKGKKQPAHAYLYWEFPGYGGQQAVRMDQWKGIRKNILKGNMNIELYNLEADLQELTDLSNKYAQIARQMEEIMAKERETPHLDCYKMEPLGD